MHAFFAERQEKSVKNRVLNRPKNVNEITYMTQVSHNNMTFSSCKTTFLSFFCEKGLHS